MTGPQPTLVPLSVIDELRAMEGTDGLIKLPDPPPPELPTRTRRYKRGQRVLIRSGVFATRTGIYDGMDGPSRERILLDVLGAQTRVSLGVQEIVPIEEKR